MALMFRWLIRLAVFLVTLSVVVLLLVYWFAARSLLLLDVHLSPCCHPAHRELVPRSLKQKPSASKLGHILPGCYRHPSPGSKPA